MYRVAVLGGGVSGLAAANRLHELRLERGADLDIALFESSPRTGGCVQTIETDNCTLELGADSLLVAKPAIAALLDRLNLSGEVVDQQAAYRGARILHGGKLRPVPPEFRLFAPRSIPALLRSGVFSPAGMLRAAMEPLVPTRRDESDESLASFVRRRLGREVLDRLAQPLIGGIYSADPARLSMEMALPQFPQYERVYGSLLGAMRNAPAAAAPHLASLRGGLGTLVRAFNERLGEIVRTSSHVQAVSYDDGWRVTIAGERTERFDAIVCALPAPAAAIVFATVEPALAAQLEAIHCNAIATINLLYDASAVTLPPATGFVVPFTERRKIVAATFTSQKYAGRTPPDTAGLRVFMGGALQPELLRQNDDALIAIARSELASLLHVRKPPFRAIVARWNNLPEYRVGHGERLAAIEQHAARLPGAAIAGCALRGVGVPDCVASGEAAAESVFGYVSGAKGAST